MSYFSDGLTVRNGRLINEQHCNDCGAPITKAAMARKAMKQAKKADVMAEAMYRADLRADLMEVRLGKKD